MPSCHCGSSRDYEDCCRPFVTGAAAGIGRAVALALAGAGADVVVHHLDQVPAANALVAQIDAERDVDTGLASAIRLFVLRRLKDRLP